MTHTPEEIAARQCQRCDTLIRYRFGDLCAACIADDIDFDPDEFDEEDAFLSFECGMMPDGYCSLAGSEDCDWECPRSVRAHLQKDQPNA